MHNTVKKYYCISNCKKSKIFYKLKRDNKKPSLDGREGLIHLGKSPQKHQVKLGVNS